MTKTRRAGPGSRSVQRPAATIKRVADRAGVSIATVSRVGADPRAVSDKLRLARRGGGARAQLPAEPRRAHAARGHEPGGRRGHPRPGESVLHGRGPRHRSRAAGRGLHAAAGQLRRGRGARAEHPRDPPRRRRGRHHLRAHQRRPRRLPRCARATAAHRRRRSVAVNLRPDLVTVDNVEGTRVGVAHLLAMGHRDVALLGGPSRHSTAKERERGYEQALRAAGRPLRPELVYYGDFREGGGYDGMKALMALAAPPDGGVRRQQPDDARRVPRPPRGRHPHSRGIALVGFDDMPWATSLNPPLTAASQPSQEIGSSAADLLLDRIARPDRAIRHLILETKLVVRASCGASLHTARPKASRRRSREQEMRRRRMRDLRGVADAHGT